MKMEKPKKSVALAEKLAEVRPPQQPTPPILPVPHRMSA